MLKKDNWMLGITLGILTPLVVYGLVFLIVKQLGHADDVARTYALKHSTMQLVGIFSNMFTFRYYMLNLKYDKTGRGILMATFLYAGIFFYLNLSF